MLNLITDGEKVDPLKKIKHEPVQSTLKKQLEENFKMCKANLTDAKEVCTSLKIIAF